jgi:PAS domain S-box-containing protein
MGNSAEPSRWMAVVLSSDATVRSLSACAEQTLGYSAAELAGRPVTHILADSTAYDVPQIMRAAREWGCWEGEIAHLHRSGKTLEARGCLALLSGRGSPEEGFLLMSTLSKPLPASVPGDYLDEVGSRLRTMIHQLNNPMAVMMGFAQLVLMETPEHGRVRSDLERLYAEMQRVTQVVERLHAFASSLQGEKAAPHTLHAS